MCATNCLVTSCSLAAARCSKVSSLYLSRLVVNVPHVFAPTDFPERLRNELRLLMNVASQRHLNIHAVANRKYIAWLGAALFASLETFPQQTMFSNDYFASGLDALLAQKQ